MRWPGTILEEALGLLLAAARPRGWEYVGLEGLLGRVLAEDLAAPHDLPPAHVCLKDGYVVRAGGWPGRARVIGSCGPGEVVRGPGEGEAVEAYSGCHVEGDGLALVPREEAAPSEGWVHIARDPAPLENLAPRGSSARSGDVVLRRGTVVGPLDLELVGILGRSFVRVYQRPRVALISVGSELSLEPPSRTTRYLTVGSIVRALGGEVINAGVVGDSVGEVERALEESLASADVVVTIGGSGPSSRDVTYSAVEAMGPEAAFRGIDVAEAARSGGAVVRGKPVIVLPGPRGPALNGAALLLAPVVSAAAGALDPPYLSLRVPLARPIVARSRSIVWVRLTSEGAEPVRQDYYWAGISGADGYLLGGPGEISGVVEVRLPAFLRRPFPSDA